MILTLILKPWIWGQPTAQEPIPLLVAPTRNLRFTARRREKKILANERADVLTAKTRVLRLIARG